MAPDFKAVIAEWMNLQKNWYAIYQWSRTTGFQYSELIPELISKEISSIELATKGLRQRGFHLVDHQGQAKLQTAIAQVTEKRFLRALFNCGTVEPLGQVVDYEVPLKETRSAKHGDIDLLCRRDDTLFLVEAKKPGSSESLLKPILQAFTYSCLVSTVRDAFLECYQLPHDCRITPTILTFDCSTSGCQLRTGDTQPALKALVAQLNKLLAAKGLQHIRFFIVHGELQQFSRCLRIDPLSVGLPRVLFCDGFMPHIEEVTL